MHNQLLAYFVEHAFISPYQSAYLKKHSTTTCLHRVVDDFSENIDDGLIAGIVFLDIEKCFDTIDHQILLKKLSLYGVNEDAIFFFFQIIFLIENNVLG